MQANISWYINAIVEVQENAVEEVTVDTEMKELENEDKFMRWAPEFERLNKKAYTQIHNFKVRFSWHRFP